MEALVSAKELIQKASIVYIASAKDANGDYCASATALFITLKKLGKITKLLIMNFPDDVAFLAGLGHEEEAIISVSTSGKTVSGLRYERSSEDLKIYLALRGNPMVSSDLSLQSSRSLTENVDASASPDLVITIGAPDLNHAGSFLKNTASWRGARVLNIDNNASNKYFGAVNLVNTGSPSVSEIITRLIESLDPNLTTDKFISTSLLTGILCATQIFKDSKTQPQTFKTAAELIQSGADYHLIIRHLHKNKSIERLRLLGKTMQRMRFANERRLAWAMLERCDFEDTETSGKDLVFVLNELKNRVLPATSLLLLWEGHGSGPLVRGIFYSHDYAAQERILQHLEGTARGRSVLFVIQNPDLKRACQKVLGLLEEKL